MEFKGKKVLLGMVYYTVIALLLAVSITFMVFLSLSDVRLYSKIGYFILTSLFVLLMIYDVICTNMNKMKFISGLILYILSVCTIIMAFIVYGLNATRGLIPADTVNVFITLIAMSFGIAVLDIIIYSVGEKLIEYNTTK